MKSFAKLLVNCFFHRIFLFHLAQIPMIDAGAYAGWHVVVKTPGSFTFHPSWQPLRDNLLPSRSRQLKLSAFKFGPGYLNGMVAHPEGDLV